MNKTMCRLCLKQIPISFSLLESNLPEMFESLTSFKLSTKDKLPTIVCYKCLLDLKIAYNIQQKIQKAQEQLQSMLNSNTKQKAEVKEQAQIKPTLDRAICESTCVICGIRIETDKISHLRSHFNDKQKCETCNKTFKNFTEYKKHYKKLKHDSFIYVCFKCGVTFKYKSFYSLHTHQAHKDTIVKDGTKREKMCNIVAKRPRITINRKERVKEMEEYKCNLCDKTFSNKQLLRSHTNRHNPIKIECSVCHILTIKENYSQHMKTHKPSPVICEICGTTLKNIKSLRGHLFHIHGNSRFECEICNKVYKTKPQLVVHNRIEHIGEKTHICDLCGKGFFTSSYLREHKERIHLKLKKHNCKYCDKTFWDKKAMRSHERQHTKETPFQCEHCGAAFKANVSLRIHRKTKHNIVEPITCSCGICGKEFSSDYALKTHTYRLHS